jgi:hypothetical protein
LTLVAIVAGGVFAQETAHKHESGDMLLGLNWSFIGAMMNANPINAFSKVGDSLKITDGVDSSGNWASMSLDLPKFFATARIINLGLSYEYYIFHWMSVGTA